MRRMAPVADEPDGATSGLRSVAIYTFLIALSGANAVVLVLTWRLLWSISPWRYPLRLVWGLYLMVIGPLLGTLVPLVVLFFVRKRARRTAGHCLNCGYDLRATPERCPECGTIPAPLPSEAAATSPTDRSAPP
jgi:hypothetical protein